MAPADRDPRVGGSGGRHSERHRDGVHRLQNETIGDVISERLARRARQAGLSGETGRDTDEDHPARILTRQPAARSDVGNRLTSDRTALSLRGHGRYNIVAAIDSLIARQ